MARKIPNKARFSGGDVVALGEMEPGDVVDPTFLEGDLGSSATITGAVNIYTAAVIAPYKAPEELTDGMRFRGEVNITNTGAATINPFGKGVKTIRLDRTDSADPVAGDMVAGQVAEFEYIDANDTVQLLNPKTRRILARGHIDGLITSNSVTDPNHDVVISQGECKGAGQEGDLFLQSSLTKRLDAVWAEGDGLGGRASSVPLSTNTWYHLFLIGKPGGTVDAGWDTDINAANLLADATGYTFYRLIWSNLTDGSSDIVPYIQRGDCCRWDVLVQDLIQANTGTAAITVPLTTPLGIVTKARLHVRGNNSTATAMFMLLTQLNQSDSTPASANNSIVVAGNANGDDIHMDLDTSLSSSIRFRASVTSVAISVQIQTIGFDHQRGKDQ